MMVPVEEAAITKMITCAITRGITTHGLKRRKMLKYVAAFLTYCITFIAVWIIASCQIKCLVCGTSCAQERFHAGNHVCPNENCSVHNYEN